MTSLIEQWKAAKQTETNAAAARRKIESEILAANDSEIKNQLDADYQTGTAKIKDDTGTLVLAFPKKVDWDNGKLETLYRSIQAVGENPAEYIEAKFTVAESKYKAWPEHIKNSFTPARTVKAGNPTFSFKE
jgi:hypothetical protein